MWQKSNDRWEYTPAISQEDRVHRVLCLKNNSGFFYEQAPQVVIYASLNRVARCHPVSPNVIRLQREEVK